MDKIAICNVVLDHIEIATSDQSYSTVSSGLLKLPSGLVWNVGGLTSYTILQVTRIRMGPSKSSRFFFKQQRLVVRGVAKNPRDHSNGGKGRGGIFRGF